MREKLSFVLPDSMVTMEPIVKYQISTGQDPEGASD